MSDKTSIEWTRGDDGTPGATWNPVTGCTRISDGCTHCYIERTPPLRMAHRRFDGEGTGSTTGVLLHPERLGMPLRWRKPRKVFVCSMADLFHDAVPDEYIAKVWATMAVCPDHTFQVLTKRHPRLRSLLSGDFRDQVAEEITEILRKAQRPRYWPIKLDRTTHDGLNIWGPMVWPLPNVWVGVTAENQQWADIRIPALLDTPAAVRFISAEPLLGPIQIDNYLCMYPEDEDGAQYPGDIDWLIVGGESGPGARPMHPDWARSLRDQCETAGVPFFLKQWGEWTAFLPPADSWVPQAYVNRANGECLDENAAIADGGSFTGIWRVGKKAAGRELDGRTWDQYPKAVTA